MDLKQIKGIISLMESSNLIEFEIEEQDLKLRIKRGADNEPVVAISPVAAATVAPAPVPESVDVLAEEEGVTVVKSPMVGTFYRAQSPETPPFVEEGQEITKGTILCIIEAMKVMNEIKAENSGTVIEILVENAAIIEYGQTLFKIKA
ncbi:MAG: acetyl-CoA carboxylase biotin carboxyl carrier protein [Opitutales bacterium]